jgi:hypothetical protein
MKTVYLNYYKANLIDYKEYMNKFSIRKVDINGFDDTVIQPYKLLIGAPQIINVEGSYIELNDLLKLSSSKDKLIVNAYIMAVKNNVDEKLIPNVEFKWRRDA